MINFILKSIRIYEYNRFYVPMNEVKSHTKKKSFIRI